jgi:hypothetical protein
MWKVASSSLSEIIEICSIYIVLPTILCPMIYSASKRKVPETKKRIHKRRVPPAYKTDGLTTSCESIV